MLYRTHHPFLFQFNPFTSLSSPATTSLPPLHLLSSPASIQVETEMERVEGALKSSIRPEMAVKSTQQALVDDVWTVNGQSGVSGDDFFVDDLLDFSNGGIEDGFIKEEHEEEEEDKGCVSVSPQEKDNSNPSSTFSVKDALASVPASELSVPADDLADLEWLSHFVEDSFSEFSLSYPTGNITGKLNAHTENRSEPENPVYRKPCFVTRFPAKARSKRTRTGGRVWSLGSPSVTESSSTSSSSSSTSHSSPWLIYTNTTQNVDSFYSVGKPPAKKHKKKPPTEAGGGAPPPRRCSHCHVQKTPQWRSGPLGAKTLCNACGVRFKSGRLLPEYRPACSPTFSSDVHSNNHRKVLEMRRKKETGRPDSGFAPAVPSF